MPVTKEEVLASLAKVAAPDGSPLPATGTLSDIVVSDAKVFFSMTVDAGAVQAWESVRKRAEEAVRALPGIQSVLVALTAERAAGAAPARRAPPPAAAQPAGAPHPARSRPARAASANRPPR
jgi:ATP-binding protein involved in chromosome partitioning